MFSFPAVMVMEACVEMEPLSAFVTESLNEQHFKSADIEHIM